MKKFQILLIALISTSDVFSQSWDFTSLTTFPSGFVIWKVDGQTANPSIGAIYSQFNTAGWIIDTSSAGGHTAATTSYFINPNAPCDRWLVTPQISIPTGQPNLALVWYGYSDDANHPDSYEVKVSSTDSATSSFITTLMSVTESGHPTVHMIPISGYAGQSVRFAFRDTSTDQFILHLTSIQVVNLPSYDMSVQDIEMYEHNYLTQPADVTGIIKNLGLNTVTSYQLNYSVNNAAAVSTQVTGVNIPPLGTALYTHTSPMNPVVEGTYTIKVWATNINGNADQNPVNDTASIDVFFYPQTVGLQKKVLLEEFTDAGCPSCPGGAFALREIAAADPNVIEVAIHSADVNDLNLVPASSADLMQVPEGEALVTAVGTGFPTAAIDREYYFDKGSIGVVLPPYTAGSGPTSSWASTASFRYNQATPVNVSLVNRSFDSVSRILEVDVNATFLNSLSQGDYRINLFVIEDSIITSGPGYDQDNFNYSNGGSGASLPNAGALNTMPTVVINDGLPGHWAHNNVLRRMEGGTWGTGGIIPSAPVSGTTYTHRYIDTLPPQWRASFVKLIGVVQEYNVNVNLRTALNAAETSLLGHPLSVIDINQISKLQVYPNPAATVAAVEIELKESAMVNVSIVNLLGQMVIDPKRIFLSAGMQTIKIPVGSLADGFYFVKVSANGQISSMTLSISR